MYEQIIAMEESTKNYYSAIFLIIEKMRRCYNFQQQSIYADVLKCLIPNEKERKRVMTIFKEDI